MISASSPAPVGILLVALGGTVMLGWLLQLPALVRVLPEYPPMVFNTALSFALAGSALVMPAAGAHPRITTAIGGFIAFMAGLVLTERAFGVDLAIDWASLHAWLQDRNPYPGRMSAPTALAFAMTGVALSVAPYARRGRLRTVVWTLTVGIGAIGLLALAGYVVNAWLLFPDYWFAHVALHTAIGLLLLAFGLGFFWQRFDWARTPLFTREDDRITFTGAAVLATVALGSGLASFAILQGRVQTLVGDHVISILTRRIETIRDLFELREMNAQIAATRPAAIRNVRVIHSGRDDGSNIANVKAVVDSFIKQGFSAIAYHDMDGRLVAGGGTFTPSPAMVVALATPAKAELLWNDGFVLRHRIPLRDETGHAGLVHTEQPLPVLTRISRDVSGMGQTGDMGLCVLRDPGLLCFPQRLNPKVFATSLVNVGGKSLPMVRALRGETGIGITQDYRAHNVVAAFGPVGDLGIGIVIKIDAAEIFQPIREQLQLVVPLLVLLVGAGTLLLRSRVRPLATDLQESREQFRAVAETANDAIVSADSRGTIIHLNPAAVRILGYSSAEALGRPLTMLMPERFHEAHRAGFQRYLATGRASILGRTLELFARRKDGLEFPIEISIATWTTSKGVFFTAILRDITARREAAEALRQRTAELEASNRELEAFSYSISHDLRAPLRHMDGFVSILREESGAALSDAGRRYIDIVSDSARHMGRLVDDLLNFSRMGRVEMRQGLASMAELVDEVRRDLAGDMGGRSIEWDIGPLPDVRGDRAMLKQVWVNLVSNAVKYTRKRDLARIRIGCSRNDGELEFQIEDNGAGFDMRYVDKLFGVFQRLHRAEEFEGSGVGLANVQRIVTRHGGRTWAHGIPGSGATFYFTLPAAVEAVPDRAGNSSVVRS
jgi:PAS domain S-box-containing protein